MGADGAILGSAAGRPGEGLGKACESLRMAMKKPMLGRPHRPDRVRVASAALAEARRGGDLGVEVVCAPSPDMDALLADMRQKFSEGGEAEQTWLPEGVEPEAVAALHRAPAALYRAKPWKIVPDDESLFAVSVEALGLRDAALSVIGQKGQSFALLFFASLGEFGTFLDAAEAIDDGEEAEIPPHFALSFERGADLPPALRKEVASHG